MAARPSAGALPISTVHPGIPARAPRSPPPPRAGRPRRSRRHVHAPCFCRRSSSTFPRRQPAAAYPTASFRCGTYSPQNGRHTRGAGPWRARAAAVAMPRRRAMELHPVLLRANRRQGMCCHVPVWRRQGQAPHSARACLAWSWRGCLSAMHLYARTTQGGSCHPDSPTLQCSTAK